MRAPAALALLAALMLAGCLGAVQARLSPGGTPVASSACAYPCDVVVAAGTYREFEPSVGINPLHPDVIVLAAAEDFIADAPGYVQFPLGLESPITGSNGPLQTPGSYRIGIHTSHDAGATWTTHFLPWTGNAPPTSLWNQFCVYGDPVLAYDPQGVLHLVNVASHCATELKADQGFSLIHSASADDGATWGEPSFVIPGQFMVLIDDKPWFAIDPATGRLAVSWTAGVGLGYAFDALAVTVSEDGGATWSPPSFPITAGGLAFLADTPLYDEAPYNYFSSVAWGPGGALHVASMDYCTPPPVPDLPDCVKASTSTDLGATWQVTQVSAMDNPGRAGAQQVENAYPAIGVDRSGGPRDGRVYVAYVDAATGDYDALLRWSDDGGATWSAALRLSTDPVANGADQFHLGLAVDAAGVVHAAFWDRRADPANRAIQTTWARFDPATGALGNQALELPWDPDPGSNGGQFLGDYSTVAASGGRVAIAWDAATAQKPGTLNTNIPWDLDLEAAVLTG